MFQMHRKDVDSFEIKTSSCSENRKKYPKVVCFRCIEKNVNSFEIKILER